MLFIFLTVFFINIDEDYCITFKSPSIIDFLDYECDKNNLWETLIDFSFCYEQLCWLYDECIDHNNENELLEKLIIKFTNPEIFTKLSDEDFLDNIATIILLVDSINSTIYDKHFCKLFNHDKSKNLPTDTILELIEYNNSYDLPQNSVVLDFFINHCYPIFAKLESKENITRDECELLCAVIIRYIEQINASENIQIKQKIFINMDNLIKTAQKYVNNDNPNDLQSIYADHLLEIMQ